MLLVTYFTLLLGLGITGEGDRADFHGFDDGFSDSLRTSALSKSS